MMHRDDDESDYTPTVTTGPMAHQPPTTLPENEPHALPLAAQHSDLVDQIDALEGALQYMGSLHPQRDALRQRLSGLRSLLERWDRSQHLQRGEL